MDGRSLRDKMDATARCSEPTTKLIVVGPSVVRIKEWCEAHGKSQHTVITVCGAQSATKNLQGTKGLPHIILGWAEFSDEDRDVIRAYLEITGSVPYDDEGETNVVDPAVALRG